MYYLFDTCTTRCSINAHTRPRSHLRIVPIGSDNTSRTKCASSDSEIASNFSLSLSFCLEKLENRGTKSVSKRATRRDTLLLLSTPHNAPAHPLLVIHPRGGFFSAQPIITRARVRPIRGECRSLQTMRIGAFSVQNFFHPRRGHHVLTLAKSVESGRAARRFYANFAPSFRFQPLLPD